MTNPRRLAWLTLAFVTLCHWHVHLGYLRGLNTTRVPASRTPAPKSAPSGDGVRHAVLLVLDGLGWEKGIAAPPLRALADAGAGRMMRAEFPTFTYPGITAMMTGRPPLYSGVRINGPRPRLPWDSLPKRAAAAGYTVRYDPEIFASFASLLLLPDGALRIDASDALPPAAPRTLDLLYDGRVDRAAHRGGTGSATYREAVAAAAAHAERVWSSLDPAQDLLVVVSEHGHRPAGGHGGAEPEAARAMLVAAGKGVAPRGIVHAGWMRDLAPTVAAMLGTEAPADSLGAPMTEVLGLGHEAPRAYDRDAAHDDAVFREQALVRTSLVALALVIAAAWLARRGALAPLTAQDFTPFTLYAALVTCGHTALSLSVSWSSPTSQVLYSAQTALVGIASTAIAIRFATQRERAAYELLATLLVCVPAFALALAWVGLSLERIAGPFASFGFLLTVTVAFFVCAGLALRVLWITRAPASSATRVAAWGGAAIAGLAIYVAPVLGRFWLPR